MYLPVNEVTISTSCSTSFPYVATLTVEQQAALATAVAVAANQQVGAASGGALPAQAPSLALPQ